MLLRYALNMPANLENSAVATGLEKVSFHSNPQKRECRRMFRLLHISSERLPAMRETQVRSLGQEDPWRRKWQSTPVSLPGESHGWRSLGGYSPRGHKESDTTERLHFHMLAK